MSSIIQDEKFIFILALGAHVLRTEKISEAHGNSHFQSFRKLSEIPRAFGQLIVNPTFTLLSLAGASEGFLISGFAAFLPKLMENEFSISASFAAILMGRYLHKINVHLVVRKAITSVPTRWKVAIITITVTYIMTLFFLLIRCELDVSKKNTEKVHHLEYFTWNAEYLMFRTDWESSCLLYRHNHSSCRGRRYLPWRLSCQTAQLEMCGNHQTLCVELRHLHAVCGLLLPILPKPQIRGAQHSIHRQVGISTNSISTLADGGKMSPLLSKQRLAK